MLRCLGFSKVPVMRIARSEACRRPVGALPAFATVVLSACAGQPEYASAPTVQAHAETEPVPGYGDAADDPGLLVVQDGSNTAPRAPQNGLPFKLVPWTEVQRALSLER
jgi:myo-inositol-hexaphosphate 3-phosphohydrolase